MWQRSHHKTLQLCGSFALLIGCFIMAPLVNAEEWKPIQNSTKTESTIATEAVEPGKPYESSSRVDAAATAELQSLSESPIHREQVARDKLFVQCTFVAAAALMCTIAFFLFISMPKAAKKTQ